VSTWWTAVAAPRSARPALPLRIESITSIHHASILLIGEADFATVDQLDAALATIGPAETRAVHLHVAELHFVDAAAMHHLASFARHVRRLGHNLNTCGANSTFTKVARVLHVHDDLRRP
jgi:anti-anti-sigma regulatory factor